VRMLFFRERDGLLRRWLVGLIGLEMDLVEKRISGLER
jgi:hypothetical protein